MSLRALVTCTAENRPAWAVEVENLFLSLRRFGGSLANAPLLACFVDSIDDELRQRLEGRGIDIRLVPRSTFGPPTTNKLAMLWEADHYDFDVLVAVDCDVVFVGDLGPYLAEDAVQAKPANRTAFPPPLFEKILSRFDLPAPSWTVRLTESGEASPPYFNAGVVTLPAALLDRARDRWRYWTQRYAAISDHDRDLIGRRVWADQIGLACMAIAGEIPLKTLPARCNLSTGIRPHPAFAEELLHPVVLHYHNEMDARGFIRESANLPLNPTIDRFNAHRAQALDLPYRRLPKPPAAHRLVRYLKQRRWHERVPPSARRSSLARAVRRFLLS